MTPMPDHIKRKLLKIFAQTSVPRIIKEERNKQKGDSGKTA